MREVGLVKYCLALADRVTEGRCNDCWGEGAGDCSWHRKCKEDNLRERQHWLNSSILLALTVTPIRR
jgi:hypothetical protein